MLIIDPNGASSFSLPQFPNHAKAASSKVAWLRALSRPPSYRCCRKQPTTWHWQQQGLICVEPSATQDESGAARLGLRLSSSSVVLQARAMAVSCMNAKSIATEFRSVVSTFPSPDVFSGYLLYMTTKEANTPEAPTTPSFIQPHIRGNFSRTRRPYMFVEHTRSATAFKSLSTPWKRFTRAALYWATRSKPSTFSTPSALSAKTQGTRV